MLAALRRHPLLTGAFALAALATLVLLLSVGWSLLTWERPGRPRLEPWMTVGVVGHLRDVNPRAIDAAAGFPTPEEAGRPLTLAEIAQARGVPVEEVIAEAEAAVEELHGQGGERGPHDGPPGLPP